VKEQDEADAHDLVDSDPLPVEEIAMLPGGVCPDGSIRVNAEQLTDPPAGARPAEQLSPVTVRYLELKEKVPELGPQLADPA
jgi:hypothetical protein